MVLLLKIVSYQGQSDVVQFLLQKPGIDVNSADPHGFTPLMYAASAGDLETFQTLREYGGNEGSNRFGSAALMISTFCGHMEIVKYLLGQDDVDVNARDILGHTALSAAVQNGHI